MKKSWWIRFWGWACLLCWGSGLLVLLNARSLPHTPGLGVLLILCYGAGFLCFGIWALGSLLWHAVGRAKVQQAAAARDMLAAQARALAPSPSVVTLGPDIGAQPAPAPGQAAVGEMPLRAREITPAPDPLMCVVCGVYAAAWFCNAHSQPVCMTHLAAHDTPWCVYVPASRVKVMAAAPAQSARKAAGGVLGLS